MNVQTVQGTISGKGWFKKLVGKVGKAFASAGKFVWKAAQKLNPALIPARAAFLKIVATNTWKLADKFAAKGPDKARSLWEKLGGDYSKFKQAIEQGKGKKVNGIMGLAGQVNGDDEFWRMMDHIANTGGVRGIGVVPAIMAVISIAKPLLMKILQMFGIKPGAPADEAEQKMAEEMGSMTSPPLVETVQTQVDQALDTQRPRERGTNRSPDESGSGMKKALPWILGGTAIVAALVLPKMRGSQSRKS